MISLVAHTIVGSANATDVTATLNASGANFFAVSSVSIANTVSPNLIDSLTNSWNQLTMTTNFVDVRLWYAFGASAGSGQTFTFSGTGSNFPSIAVAAFAGVDTSSPFDQQNGAAYNVASSAQPGSVTPSVNSELIITNIGFNNTVSSVVIDSSFSTPDFIDIVGGLSFGSAMAWKIQGGASSENPTWSWNPLNPVNGGSRIATFKASAGGGGTLKTVEGLITANIKTVDGLAIANVKTLQGLTP